MYLNVLKFQNQIDSQTESINEFRAEVHHLKKYVSGNWAPSKTQQVNIPNGLFRIRSHSQVYLSQELLSQLLGHWLIKPLQSYDKIYVRVKVSLIVSSTLDSILTSLPLQNFVHVRAEWLHLGVYVLDPIARSVVDKYLQKTAGEMKATFRKDVSTHISYRASSFPPDDQNPQILASIKERKSLDDFARAMLQKYHCPVIPNEPPRDVLATLAFLVSVLI